MDSATFSITGVGTMTYAFTGSLGKAISGSPVKASLKAIDIVLVIVVTGSDAITGSDALTVARSFTISHTMSSVTSLSDSDATCCLKNLLPIL